MFTPPSLVFGPPQPPLESADPTAWAEHEVRMAAWEAQVEREYRTLAQVLKYTAIAALLIVPVAFVIALAIKLASVL